MPHFNIACDDCKIIYRAHVSGFRAQRVGKCPVCGGPQRSRQWETVLRLEKEGYRLVRLVWGPDTQGWQVVDEQGNVIPQRVQPKVSIQSKSKVNAHSERASSWDEAPKWLLEG